MNSGLFIFVWGFVCGAIFAAAVCGIAVGAAEMKKSREEWRHVRRGGRF
jgi:uncharacterized membrane protein